MSCPGASLTAAKGNSTIDSTAVPPTTNMDGKIELSFNLTGKIPPLPLSIRTAIKSGADLASDVDTEDHCPALNIVIFIVGSRGTC